MTITVNSKHNPPLNPDIGEAYHDLGTAFLLRGLSTLRESEGVPEAAVQDIGQSLADFTIVVEQNPESKTTAYGIPFLNGCFIGQRYWL